MTIIYVRNKEILLCKLYRVWNKQTKRKDYSLTLLANLVSQSIGYYFKTSVRREVLLQRTQPPRSNWRRRYKQQLNFKQPFKAMTGSGDPQSYLSFTVKRRMIQSPPMFCWTELQLHYQLQVGIQMKENVQNKKKCSDFFLTLRAEIMETTFRSRFRLRF